MGKRTIASRTLCPDYGVLRDYPELAIAFAAPIGEIGLGDSFLKHTKQSVFVFYDIRVFLMGRFSAFSLAWNALSHHQKWARYWQNPPLAKKYDV